MSLGRILGITENKQVEWLEKKKKKKKKKKGIKQKGKNKSKVKNIKTSLKEDKNLKAHREKKNKEKIIWEIKYLEFIFEA